MRSSAASDVYKCQVHHSLTRNTGEFDFGIDNTEHQLYFRAIGFSVALRMALLAAVVGVN